MWLFDHARADLSSESPISHFVAVLSSHRNLGIYLDKVNVGGGGCTNHLCVSWHLGCLQSGDEFPQHCLLPIHLTFSPNKKLPEGCHST